MDTHTPPLLWFADIDLDHEQVSSEARKLAKLYQAKFPVLPGFVITNTGFQQFIRENNLEHKIRALLSTLDPSRPESVMQGASIIRRAIQDAPIPQQLAQQILEYYTRLNDTVIAHTYLSPKHGIKHSAKQVASGEEMLTHIKDMWIDQYDAETLAKRHDYALDHITTGAEVIIIPHVDPEVSGKAYTIHPDHHDKNTLIITHKGDVYELSKKTLTILKRHLREHARYEKLQHKDIHEIAKLAREVEKLLYFPQEITWAKFGEEIILLTTKPISSHPKVVREKKVIMPIARGTSITKTIGSGIPISITKDTDLSKLTTQHIMVVSEIKPEHLRHVRHIRGIISEQGELHSEIVTRLRQHGIPTVFHVNDAHKLVKQHVLTIHAGRGEIYLGGMH